MACQPNCPGVSGSPIRWRSTVAGVPLGIPLHPTQLYESAAEFIIFGVLYWRIGNPHRPGAIISLYLILYSAARFAVEFVRFHEQPNPFGGPLNTSQYISLALIALGAAYFLRPRKHELGRGLPAE